MTEAKTPLDGLIAAALGEIPADLILANARIVNTLTGEIERGNVAIWQEWVIGIGDYQGKETIDLEGKYLAPGFIDAHIHLESTMLHPAQYARVAVPRGTLGVVTDLHEVANVCGVEGVRRFILWTRGLPLDFFFMAPSCVPAAPGESAGAVLGASELKRLLNRKEVAGLGEMMNFPGVLSRDAEVLEKISLASGKPVDGHAPGLRDKALNAYLAAGILSDHETTELAEGREKLRRGMYLMIREGSSEKNLEALLPLVDDNTYPRCLFAIDDRTCADLVHDGDMDAVLRKAISLGLDPVRAIRLATLNVAQYLGRRDLGAVAPGFRANLVVLSDLERVSAELVFYRGKLVARGGKLIAPLPRRARGLENTVRVKPFSLQELKLRAGDEMPAIEVLPGQIVTRKAMVRPKIEGGEAVADPERDILKLVVVERHRATGNIGVGLVRGFGLREGALASSISHDSHNLIAVGAADGDIFVALQEIIRHQGGLAVAAGGKVLESLPLPIAGLLSPQPAEEVAARVERLERLAAGLGCRLPSPFAALSFLALPVIPEIRLTDKGIVTLMSS